MPPSMIHAEYRVLGRMKTDALQEQISATGMPCRPLLSQDMIVVAKRNMSNGICQKLHTASNIDADWAPQLRQLAMVTWALIIVGKTRKFSPTIELPGESNESRWKFLLDSVGADRGTCCNGDKSWIVEIIFTAKEADPQRFCWPTP